MKNLKRINFYKFPLISTNFHKSQWVLIFILLCSPNCSRKGTEAELGPEEEFKLGMERYEQKDYDKSADRFKRIVFRFPGSKWTEEAQYRLARSHFFCKDYSVAKIEYDFFINSYPRSRFTDDAAFEAAVCGFYESMPYYLDPSSTKTTLQEFQVFIKRYSDSELVDSAKVYAQKCVDKLVRKDLETAKLYIKMDKYASAVLYLKDIQSNYPDNSYRDEIANLLTKYENLITP